MGDESMDGPRKRAIKIPIEEGLYEELETIHREEGRSLEELVEEALLDYRRKRRFESPSKEPPDDAEPGEAVPRRQRRPPVA